MKLDTIHVNYHGVTTATARGVAMKKPITMRRIGPTTKISTLPHLNSDFSETRGNRGNGRRYPENPRGFGDFSENPLPRGRGNGVVTVVMADLFHMQRVARGFDIIMATKYANAPAMLATSEGVTQEVSAPMRDKSIPNVTESAIEPEDFVLVPVQKRGAHPVFAKVDRCDADMVSQHRWGQMVSRHSTYARRGYRENGKIVTSYMHTLILGVPPEGMVIDHINGDGLDNRRENLRFATQSENRRNSSRLSPGSKFTGIAQLNTGKWIARIVVEGKRLYLGVFDSEEDAALAYDFAAEKNLGEFARLNFPKELDVRS